MIKVRALDTYQILGVKDEVLKRIPKAGEVFEVSEDRLKTLLEENDYNAIFVEVIEEPTKGKKNK